MVVCCILVCVEGGDVAIGACRTLADNVAFGGSVQRVVDTEGIPGTERETIYEQRGLAGGGGLQGYVSCRVSVGDGEPVR